MLKNVALLAASAVFAILMAEAGLRIADVSYPQWYVEDADLGGALRPGAQGRYHDEGDAYVEINSAGMRDREHRLRKPPGTLRIAVLGDSFAEAMQVDRDRTFWAVLEQRLKACPALNGREPEVLNFGVSGYGTAQEYIALRQRVRPYDPDIVVLAFFTGNDVRNNNRTLNSGAAVPYFRLDNGRLALDDSFRKQLAPPDTSTMKRLLRATLAPLRNHMRLLQLATHVQASLRQRQAARDDMAANEKRAAEGGEPGIDAAVYSPPRDLNWDSAWRTTEALLAAMRDEVRGRGKQFWVVTLSTGIQVHPDVSVKHRFARNAGIKDLFYPDRRIAAFAAREDIPAITLAPAMAQWAESNKTYLHGFANAIPGFGHWNEAGNALAGRLIAERLCSSIEQPAAHGATLASSPEVQHR